MMYDTSGRAERAIEPNRSLLLRALDGNESACSPQDNTQVSFLAFLSLKVLFFPRLHQGVGQVSL